MGEKKKLSKKLLVALLTSLAIVGQGIKNSVYAEDTVPVPTLDKLHNAGTTIPNTNPPVIYPESAYTITEGTADDYNFTNSFVDNTGTLVTQYYKINLNQDTLNSDIGTWQEVSQPGNQTISVILPGGEQRYFQFVHKMPENYYYASQVIEVSQPINNAVFTGQTSTSMGGAIANLSDNSNNNINAYFVGNNASNNELAAGGAICNIYGALGNINGDFITNSAMAGSNTGIAGGGAIANIEGTINNINGHFVNSISASLVNSTSASTYSSGGAIVNQSGMINNVIGAFVGNQSIADYNASGGALANVRLDSTQAQGIISNIAADFISNYTLGINSYGGAIINENSTIGNITGDFLGNYSTALYDSSGGAIFNSIDSTINNISGNFIGNNALTSTTNSAVTASGGAIYNYGNIENINSKFINNTVASAKSSLGGAIANDNQINTITGNFINNSVTSTETLSDYANFAGGAIYNSETIGTIKGDFVSNTAYTTTYGTTNATANGGAIYNTGTIGTLQGNYINNSSVAPTYTTGGAIDNNGTIGNIESDFSNNLTLAANAASGSAIYNNDLGTIENISGNFTNNRAISLSGSSGGAIFNNGTIGTINEAGKIVGGIVNSNFIDNYIEATQGYTYGAAIYTSEDLNIIADNGTSTFKGNIANSNGNVSNSAIFVSANLKGGATLTLDAKNNGQINMYDSIDGTNDANVILTGDSTGIINLYDDIKNVNVSTNDVNINFSNNETHNYVFNKLDSDSSTKYSFDVDASGEQPVSDTLTVGSGSTGTVTVSEVNFINDTSSDKEFIVQLLDTSDDSIQLAVDDSLTGENYRIGSTSKTTTDTVTSTVKWNDQFNKYTQNGTNYGEINLATTETNNDSLALKVTDTVWDDEIVTSSMGDTMALVNQLETNEERNFNFDSAEDVYNITSDLGQTSAGTININGVASETGCSTINGNNHNMFQLNNQTNLNLNNVKITGANSVASGTSKDAVINMDNVEVRDNASGITTAGSINISRNAYFENNGNGIEVTSDDSIITLNGLDGDGEFTFNDRLTGVAGAKLNMQNATANFGRQVSALDINMDNSTANLRADDLLNGLNVNVNTASNINMVNNATGTMHLSNLTLNDNLNMGVDVDLANKSMDRISADTYNLGDHNVNVSHMNLTSDATEAKTNIQFANEGLKNNVTTSVSEVAYSPIYKYGVGYDKTTGEFEFTRSNASSYNNLNPSVMVSPVAAQLGGYMGMIDTYNNAFNNMDMRMLQSASFRNAQRQANRYAIAEGTGVYKENNSAGIWARPFTSYDSVNMKHGPSVHSLSYGTFIGGDSGYHDFGNGYEGVFSTHISYQGSHQTFADNSIYQNGVNLGFTGTLYKGNFFTGLNATTGVSIADASTMYGDENFPMLMAGVASKTGYNFEFKGGKFIIQPSLLLSYTFVNTFDYTNAGGVKIDAQPLHAMQISPNIRFSLNTENGWQPYFLFGANWNLMNNSENFLANATALPELSIRPYFHYGLGVQKLFNDNFTGYAQVMLRHGGRNGIAATAGMRYLFGHTPKDNNNVQKEDEKETIKQVYQQL